MERKLVKTIVSKIQLLSLQILDISRMLAKAAQSKEERQAERDADDGNSMKNHPVIRTMYDHESVGIASFPS